MLHWNAVITVREGGFTPARHLLEAYGEVHKSEFFNTLVMLCGDPFQVLDQLQGMTGDGEEAACISRFMPMQRMFSYQSAGAFEQHARDTVQEWLPQLAGAQFHVRMHRRGFKGRLSSMEEERQLDEFLLDRLLLAGTPGKVAFDDPDAIIAIETVGPQAGLSLLRRERLQRYPLLHLD